MCISIIIRLCLRVHLSRSEAFCCTCRVPGLLPVLPLWLRLGVRSTAAYLQSKVPLNVCHKLGRGIGCAGEEWEESHCLPP
jgi:hypothetical protein